MTNVLFPRPVEAVPYKDWEVAIQASEPVWQSRFPHDFVAPAFRRASLFQAHARLKAGATPTKTELPHRLFSLPYLNLRPIAGVDVDVFLGEIAGPHALGAAAVVQIDGDRNIFF